MVLIIEDLEAERLARAVADRTGETLAEVVINALRDRLTREERVQDQAEETLLDQNNFFLDPKDHEKFVAMLDRPAKATAELRAILRRKPSWGR